ncbi:hypothetical protein [Oceanibium sediminis]|uniref:hypothetical protein n=1 Tax=Oceanibium sediminis TaxID=2026339 RepID=UPI0013006A6E|nr:hypothetical protein [Oceanibium sediminis]
MMDYLLIVLLVAGGLAAVISTRKRPMGRRGKPMSRARLRRGLPPNAPPGHWRSWALKEPSFAVAGTSSHLPAAQAFGIAALEAAQEGAPFGVVILRAPGAPDAVALEVHGHVGAEGADGPGWHIGYVPAEIARALRDIHPEGALAAEVERVNLTNTSAAIRLRGLVEAPPG